MSVNFDPKQSSINTENVENQEVPTGESASIFDRIPTEILERVFRAVPHVQLNTSDIGPHRVCRRWHAISNDLFRKQSYQSPKKPSPPLQGVSKAPRKKRSISFRERINNRPIPFSLD